MTRSNSSYPLSPLQEGMLIHQLYGAQPGVDIEQLVLTLPEPIDSRRMACACTRLIARHDLLRTRFCWEGSAEPVQEVCPSIPLPWSFFDWRESPGSLETFLFEDRVRGFPLDEAPLLRITLIQRGEADFILVWTFHHAILDGRCFAPLIRELFALYENPEAELPAPRPYHDFIEWQRAQDFSRAQEHFSRLLSGMRAPTPLTVERLGDAGGEGHGAETLTLSEADTDALRRLAQDHGLTLNTLVQGAWATLLHRYSGEQEIVFGATRACRYGSVEGADEMIGPLINTLPMRVHLTPETPLLSFLKELRTQHIAIRPHEHAPLSLAQAASEIPVGVLLFESLVVFENFALEEELHATGPEWKKRRFSLLEQTNFPLTLAAYGGSALLLRLDYERARFSANTMQRMLGHLAALLRGMAEGPERAIGELPLLAPGEREALIGDAPKTFPVDWRLHERFEAQVAKNPDAPALTLEGETLSYGELNRRANRLAHRLIARGARAGTLIGLHGERTIELIVGLIAILKSGAAYLPIDVAYPPERLAFMLKDADAPLLLTQKRLLDGLPEGVPQTLLLDDDDYSSEPDTNPNIAGSPDDLAYVIYTSGSTGKPKGARLTHRNVARLFLATDDWFGFGPDDVWSLFHSHAFDFSVWELWGALLYGGRVVLVPHLVSRSPDEFRALLASEGVTVLNQTPSAFRQLIGADAHSDEPLTLRYVIFGGEALDLASLRPWTRRYGDSSPRLINMYGITETCVHVTYRPLTTSDIESASGSVIGVPLPDLSLHVLDGCGEPAPLGVPGELFVGGAGLALGYLNRPELTDARFLPDHLHPTPGARLYRTGDGARRLPGGDIEYLGRLDQQVQLRGFRIELGEIESALSRVGGVREATVLCREDVPGEQRLVAYLVAQREIPVGELRAALSASLPGYMIPSAFVFLDAFPLTTNGKLDRKALPAPGAPARAERGDIAAPRTPEEAALLGIWQAVLRQESIGIHDNFFERGGDSILSIHVLSRARQAGLILTARQIFEHPSIAAQAAVATRAQAGATYARPTGELALTPIQRWFFAQNLPQIDHYNQAFVFELRTPVSLEALRAALQQVADRHDAFRLRFERAANGDWRQFYANEASVAALEGDGAPEDMLNISHGPLLAAALRPDGTVEIAVHHLAIDGVSWRPLLEDLDAALSGRSLTPPTAPFGLWPGALAAREIADGEAEHWQETLAATTLTLPKERSGPNIESSARTAFVSLSEDETRRLLEGATAALRAKIQELLLTALAQSLAPWLGEGRLRVDVEGHGRDGFDGAPDVSRSVGWFTTIYPVLLPIGGDVKAIKAALRAVPSPALPALADRTGAQLAFNYLGQLDTLTAGLETLALSETPSGPWHGPDNPRSHLIEALGQVRGGRLTFGFTYSESVHTEATIAALASRFGDALRAILTLAETAPERALAPSDFSLASLDEPTLARLVGENPAIEDIYPLSPMQKLFYSMEATGAGFERWCFKISGPLDAVALRRAWEGLLSRHSILRTAFVSEGLPEPLQIVRPTAALPWSESDTVPPPAPFDLTRAPLLRLTLVKTGSNEHELIWDTHHLLMDGWSWIRLFGELATLYENPDAPLPPATPYRHYIAYLKRQKGAGESYWRAALAGVSPLAGRQLLAGGQGPTERRASVSLAPLEALARRNALTVGTLLQAGWALLMAHHAGRGEVVFGASFSGRPESLPGALELIGPLVTNLPVRLVVKGSESLGDWLATLQREHAARMEHQDASPDELQLWSGLPPHQRLFESLVVFQNYGSEQAHLGACTVRLADTPDSTAYPLTLVAKPAGETLALKLTAHRMGAEETERLLSDLMTTLEAMVHTPDATLGELLARLAPPLPQQSAPRRAATMERPSSQREAQLAALWEEMLGIEGVGRHENFFDLGGHSVLLVALHARLRERLGIEIPIVTLLQYPTIHLLARHLEGGASGAPLDDAQERARRQREAQQRLQRLRR